MTNQEEINELIGKVVKCQEDQGEGYFEIVIDKGSNDGVQEGQRFLVYEVGEEIIDQDTKESLGKIEIVKGVGKVKHIQPKLTTIKSIEKKLIKNNLTRTIRKNSYLGPFFGGTEEITDQPEEISLPFINAKIGDFAKLVLG